MRSSFLTMLIASLVIHGTGVVAASTWQKEKIVVPKTERKRSASSKTPKVAASVVVPKNFSKDADLPILIAEKSAFEVQKQTLGLMLILRLFSKL